MNSKVLKGRKSFWSWEQGTKSEPDRCSHTCCWYWSGGTWIWWIHAMGILSRLRVSRSVERWRKGWFWSFDLFLQVQRKVKLLQVLSKLPQKCCSSFMGGHSMLYAWNWTVCFEHQNQHWKILSLKLLGRCSKVFLIKLLLRKGWRWL